MNQWLEVTVNVTANTGLAAANRHYWGVAPADTSNTTADALVTDADAAGANANPRGARNQAPVDFAYDFDRDKLVNNTDVSYALNHKTGTANGLRLVSVRP